jgi:outer membrane protein OmpA-like peptidoglycan-associated protein
MNTSNKKLVRFNVVPALVLGMSMVVAGCATVPPNPEGSAEVRSRLSSLQSDPLLADLAPIAIREAEASVELAEQPVGKDVALGEYRVYMADRKVAIAMAKASTRYSESQRAGISQARDEARLAARTQEADNARRNAEVAESEADAARALAAASVADATLDAAAAAESAEELRQQISKLQAEATDRGLILTLGNTLFATSESSLKPGRAASLDKLVDFLNQYPDRKVVIEGHTDDVGSLEMNQTLSQNRADAVRSYLMQQGIESRRITAAGMGETQPVADNLSASGRQQNRRVEVIIENPVPIVPAASIN